MPRTISQASWLASDPQKQSEFLASLSDDEALALLYDWGFWARPNQIEPADDRWVTWLLLAGRGFGKTRIGAETIRDWVETGKAKRIALVGPTAADVRDVMIEGESGLLAISPPWNRPVYEPSKRRLTWPNGALATAYSADEPQRLRGPQHDAAWCDELAAWRYPEAWDQLQFGLRLGAKPRVVVTTTPKGVKLIRDLVKESTTIVTRGATRDNAQNLAPTFLAKIVKRYEGTRLGRQELDGDILEDVPGALWSRAHIDRDRVREAPDLTQIVVAVDPPISSEEGADECGIIVAGKTAEGEGYILADISKGQLTPSQWASRAVAAYHQFGADRIVAEVNQGGEMVRSVLLHEDAAVPVQMVHATRGKAIRAEPVATLYEQGRVHHVGTFAELEDQMCAMTLDFDRKTQGSPDRMDALVWAITDLMPALRAREPRIRTL